MYVYKSTAESRVANVVDWSDFAGSAKPHCGRGREGPCFAVCALVCDPVGKAECLPDFRSESKRGAFVREVENRDAKRFEIEFETAALPDFSRLLIVGVHREPGNVCI